VLIYPTAPIIKYLKDRKLQKEVKKNEKTLIKNAFSISDFYVALTRARYSVGIVLDHKEDDVFIEGVQKWKYNP
jgi:DNA helicase-2/ATP-dependent DNA helicase PcrA